MKPGKIIIIILGLLLIAIIAFLVFEFSNLTVYKTAPFDRQALFENAPATPAITGDCLTTTAEVTAVAIHSGDLSVMLSNPIDLTNPALAGVEDRKITVPIHAYLIHHEKYGYFLIDSGCSSSYAENTSGTLTGLLVSNFVPQTILDPADAIEVQLADTLPEVKGVFFTHLHFDHTSGLPALPPDIPFFADKNEISINLIGLLEAHHFESTDVIYQFDFAQSTDLPLGQAIDIFGDQSVWAISAPGHSAGSVCYLINTPGQSILIAGDAINTNDCLELGVRSGTCSANPAQDQQTVDRLKAYLDVHPEIEVWCGHGEAK
jgi:glyoxylase-like metal-dependent hydrolase (beta-lactamase superfamily II)